MRLHLLSGGGPAPVVDLDFVNNIYVGGTLASLLSTSRASTKFLTSSDYTLASIANNITPRSDIGLLVEPARTNVILRSQEFDDAAWNKSNVTVTANDAVAPDGTTTADKLVFANPVSETNQIYQNVSVSSAIYVRSGYIKGTTGQTITLSSAEGVDYIHTLSGHWDKVSIAPPVATTGPYLSWRISSGVGETARTVWVWGAQIEAGSFASSYAATTTASVTRAADSITLQPTGIRRVKFTFDDNSSQIAEGIDPATQYIIPTTLNRSLIRRMRGYA